MTGICPSRVNLMRSWLNISMRLLYCVADKFLLLVFKKIAIIFLDNSVIHLASSYLGMDLHIIFVCPWITDGGPIQTNLCYPCFILYFFNSKAVCSSKTKWTFYVV